MVAGYEMNRGTVEQMSQQHEADDALWTTGHIDGRKKRVERRRRERPSYVCMYIDEHVAAARLQLPSPSPSSLQAQPTTTAPATAPATATATAPDAATSLPTYQRPSQVSKRREKCL